MTNEGKYGSRLGKDCKLNQTPLLPYPPGCRIGRLLRREKRFSVAVELDARPIWAHTNNTGSMLGLLRPGSPVLLSPATNPARKLAWTVEALGLGTRGVSAPDAVTKEMVQTMNAGAVIFACANPTPEIFPDEARAAGAAVVSTGRSDYPNQINNVLAFPGIFRGAFDVRASDINEPMKLAAAHALAALITPEELSADYIIPKAFDPRVGPAVAAAVAQAARESGVARI